MHKKLGWIVGLAHALFYIGIGMMIYLYFIDNNSPLWLGSILLVIVGIVGSAIPDSMINIGIEGISIQKVRWTMALKYIVFMGLNLFLTKFFWVTSIGVILILGVDSFLEIKLAKEINNTQVVVESFLKRLDKFDATKINQVFKYVLANIFFVLLFLSVHENVKEFVVMMLINIAVYFFTTEKILKNLEDVEIKEIWKCRMILWMLEVFVIFSVYYNLKMITLGLLSTYYMIVTDITLERKTSVVKLRPNRK